MILLVLSAPLLLVLLGFVLLVDGRPLLYRGERLGIHRRRFVMYKVRTLRREAAQVTATRLLSAKDELEIRGARFLRESRLDELPQLWNIVRGEMSFVGPRPERELVYRLHCQHIPGYARRFAVRPGLVGPSQLFTPHATPKRIRTWLDNSWGRRRASAAERIALTAYTAFAAAAQVSSRALEWSRTLVPAVIARRGFRERRGQRRARTDGALASLWADDSGVGVTGWLLDLNEEDLRVHSPHALAAGAQASLGVILALGGSPAARLRHAWCDVRVRQARRVAGGHELVLEYRPMTDRSHYVLQQYFLRNALAGPRRAVRAGRAPTAAMLAVLQHAMPGLREQRATRRAWDVPERRPWVSPAAGVDPGQGREPILERAPVVRASRVAAR